MIQNCTKFFLALLLFSNCFGELEILNSDNNKKTKSQKNAEVACALAQNTYFSSCVSNKNSASYCSALYGQCTLACALTQSAFAIGCGL